MIMKYFVPKPLWVGLKELPYVMLYALLTVMVIFNCILYFSILVACYKLATIIKNKFCFTKNKFCIIVFHVKMIFFLINCTLKHFKGIWFICVHVRTSNKGNYRLLFLIHKQIYNTKSLHKNSSYERIVFFLNMLGYCHILVNF